LSRRRYREYVPSLPSSDARRLHALTSSWEEPILESAIDGLARRAQAIARLLGARGNTREARELMRSLDLLLEVDALHRHADNLETIAGLYSALAILAGDEPVLDDRLRAQTGLAGDDCSAVGHGPAYRETAALRSRAFHLVESLLARHARRL
jgi:hypothetical protein